MSKARQRHPKEPESGYGGHDGDKDEFDDPEQHLEIERQRFRGGLPPTPELYARAREQWYRLPGTLVRPSMDPAVGDAGDGKKPPDGQDDPNRKPGRS
jgi:hypothetical protein